MSIEQLKFHCFGEQWNIFNDTIKSEFSMSNNDFLNYILDCFKELEIKLNDNNIDYNDLKSALIPPDGKRHFDFLFVFDYSKCDDCFLGDLIFKKLLRILGNKSFKDTNTSIFSGDLLFDNTGYKEIINYINKYNIKKIEPFKSDYFVVLMSNITKNNCKKINDIFQHEEYYVGFLNITFKNDLAKANLLLPSFGLKTRDKFIMSVPEEGELRLFSNFLPKELKPVFIIDYLFDSFLTYNYQTTIYDGNEDFTNYILNPNNAENFKKYSLVVEESKYNYLISNKPHVFKILCDAQTNNIDDFKNIVMKSLSNNIFNINVNNQVVKFNTLIDINNHRLFFSFEYISKEKKIRLITAY